MEKKPPCRDTCPSGNHIREFVTTIAQAERLGKSPEDALTHAWEIYTDTSPFPAVCGRVCPAPCETGCNRKVAAVSGDDPDPESLPWWEVDRRR